MVDRRHALAVGVKGQLGDARELASDSSRRNVVPGGGYDERTLGGVADGMETAALGRAVGREFGVVTERNSGQERADLVRDGGSAAGAAVWRMQFPACRRDGLRRRLR